MIILPSRTTKKISQNNRSKLLGDLWASFNIDLQSNLGMFKVYPRMQLNTGGVANQGLSVAFKTFDQLVFTVAGTRIFKSSGYNLTSAFTEDASSGAITTYSSDYSDIELFNGTLVATSTDKVMSKASDGLGGGTWTQRATLSTADSLHKLCYFTRFNRVYYIDAYQKIKSLYTDWSEAVPTSNYSILIDYKQGFLYTMCADDQNIWIGTSIPSPSGVLNATENASILRWDGISNQITSEYKIPSKCVLALCKNDKNVMHAMTAEGTLLAFNGSNFNEIGRLPLSKEYLSNALSAKYNSFIHPNGFFFTKNGTFIVLVNNQVGDSGSTIKENLPSGIWEYSQDTGFVHRQSLSYTPMATSTITDYGQNRIAQAGALYEANIYSALAVGKPTLICGANYYTNASTSASGIFIDDPLDNVQKYGYFVTSWMLANGLRDNWLKAALRYRKLLDSADKIWLKYRTTESAPVEFTLTWSALTPTTATFTTTTDLTALVGYEVEVLQGTGSGKCAHIVSATNNAGTYTVVLDEPFTGVTSGTAKARYQNWKKTGLVVADQRTESIITTLVSVVSERIQAKLCMQFTGEDEVYELMLINSTQTPLA